jgi:hypothetical protein
MEPKIFTVAEANAILSRTIKPAMERLGNRIGAIDALKTEIEVARLVVDTGATPSNPDQQHLERLLERQRGFEADVREEIEAVHAAGGIIKDPRSGLVDFFSIVDGKLAFLCWKRGEDQIRYWHTVEEGFRGRRLLRARMPREES